MRVRNTRQPSGISRGTRVREPGYYDFIPIHPELGSTQLIMRVFEALEAKAIPFYYSYEFGDAVVTQGLREHLRTHFYIPTINTAIIVQGGFWFDDASRLQDTALAIALLEHSGIKVLWWSEPEIITRGVDDMILDSPELVSQIGVGGWMYPPTDIIRYRDYFQPPPHPIRKEREVRRRRKRRPK